MALFRIPEQANTPGLTHPRHGFEVCDVILVAYMLLMVGVTAVFAGKLPDARTPGIAFATVLIVWIAMVRVMDRLALGPVERSVIRSISLCVAFTYAFMHLGMVIEFANPFRAETTLMAIDRTLFGTNPNAFLQNYLNPLAASVFQFAYALYYPLFLVGLVMLAAREYQRFNAYLTSVVLLFSITYIGYLLVPARSPYIIAGMPEYADLIALTKPVQAGPLAMALRAALHNAEALKFDCFPSGHAAGGALVMISMFRFSRKAGWLVAPFAAALIWATIYLQYHYVIDVIAGIALAVVVHLVGESLAKATPFWEVNPRRKR